jgi:hypothetical protein
MAPYAGGPIGIAAITLATTASGLVVRPGVLRHPDLFKSSQSTDL